MKKLLSVLALLGFVSTAFAGDVGAPNTVYRMGASSKRPGFGAIDLSQSAAVTGVLSASNIPTQLAMTGNLGLASSVASNALTVSLKQADGSTAPASGSGTVSIGFRSSTATSGAFNVRSATAATSVTIRSGDTLGTVNGVTTYLWVYALDNSGTIELAISGSVFDDGTLQSTTAISGGALTSRSTLYSTNARSSVPIRLIGRLTISEATAGTWASNATEVALKSYTNAFDTVLVRSDVNAGNPTGSFSLGGSVVKFTTTIDTHNAYNASTGIFTSPSKGTYCATVELAINHASVAVNNQIGAIIVAGSSGNYQDTQVLRVASTSVLIYTPAASGCYPLNAGDTIAFENTDNATTPAYTSSGWSQSSMSIWKVSQ